MLRKTIALFLAMSLVIAVLPSMGVFAAEATNVSVVESFEDGLLDTTYFTNNFTNSAIVDGIGRNGGKALKISANSTGNFVTNKTTVASNDQPALSFDFKITKLPTTQLNNDTNLLLLPNAFNGYLFGINKRTDGKIGFVFHVSGSQRNNFDGFELNKWYRVAVTNDQNNYRVYSYLVDENGTMITRVEKSEGTSNAYQLINIMTQTDMEFVVDNIEYAVKDKNIGPALTYSSIQDNATDVSVSTKSLNVRFDTPFDCAKNYTSSKSATLTSEKGQIINCTVKPAIDYYTSMDHTVTWTGDLEYSTRYTLDFSNCKNSSGAKATGSVTFTTAAPALEDSRHYDGFERADLYTNGASSYDDGVFYSTPNDPLYSKSTKVVKDAYSGDYALKIYQEEAGTKDNPFRSEFISKNAYSKSADKNIVITYRMKLKYPTTGNNRISIGMIAGSPANNMPMSSTVAVVTTDSRSGDHYIGKSPDSADYYGSVENRGFYYEEDKWYNVIWTIENDKQTFTMVDPITGQMVHKHNSSVIDNGYIALAQFPRYANINIGNAMVIDDLSMWTIDLNTDTHKLDMESIVSREYDKDAEKITLTFNQPVMPDRYDIEVYEGTDCNVSANETAKISYVDFNKIELDISNLEYANAYTLDLGGIKAVSGVAMKDTTATYSFTTKADSEHALSIIGNISSNISNGVISANTTKLNFKVNDNTGSVDTATFIAAVHKTGGEFVGADIFDDVDISGGDVELTFENNYDNVCKIRLFAWDGLATIKPLAVVEEVWGGTTEVLMIGNSLTEDSTAYLSEMAAESGIVLNQTAMIIGGSDIAHHADNLRSDLADPEWTPTEDDRGSHSYYTYVNGELAENGWTKLSQALSAKSYDVITLQEYYFDRDSFTDVNYEALEYMVTEIKKLQPNARIMLYEIWPDYTGSFISGVSRKDTFNCVISAATRMWADNLGIEVIPSGAAFMLAETLYPDNFVHQYPDSESNTDPEVQNPSSNVMSGSKGLYRDINHASYYGKYLTDAVILEAITGVQPNSSYTVTSPDGVDDHAGNLEKLREVAHKTVLESK